MVPEGVKGWREEDTIDSDSLNIINESDLSLPSRSFLSNLTTPCATPLLSPSSPSPRSLLADWDWEKASTADTSFNLRDTGGFESRTSSASQAPLYLSYCLGLDMVGLEEVWDTSEEEEEAEEPWLRCHSAPAPQQTRRRPVRRRPASSTWAGFRGQ